MSKTIRVLACFVAAGFALLWYGGCYQPAKPLYPEGAVGKIAGRVVDSISGEPIVGTNLWVVGTKTGAATNEDGRFEIVGVRAGLCTILVSCIGFNTQEHVNVHVEPDKTTNLDIKLHPAIDDINSVIP